MMEVDLHIGAPAPAVVSGPVSQAEIAVRKPALAPVRVRAAGGGLDAAAARAPSLAASVSRAWMSPQNLACLVLGVAGFAAAAAIASGVLF